MADFNFFQRIFSSMFGNSDPEAEKKRLLKATGKAIAKSKFKFYKPGNHEVTSAFAKYFYDIYKAISPAQVLFLNIQNPEQYKRWIIEFYLTDKQRELIEKLQEDNIIEFAKNKPIDECMASIRKDLQNLASFFSAELIAKIDSLYSYLMTFKDFCTYDYFFLLKKFNSAIKERDFGTTPKFENINAEYITDDLKDFVSNAWALQYEPAIWSELFALLKQAKGAAPIPANVWSKILSRMKEIRIIGTLEMLLQLCSNNPTYKISESIKGSRVAEPYLDKIRQEAEITISKIEKQQKDTKKDKYIVQIFGTTAVIRLRYYTEGCGIAFTKNNLEGYKYAVPLNCLKAFLLDFIKKDLREFCDLVLVRGKWVSTSLGTPLSDAYNSLLETSDFITAFDNTLAEDSEYGAKFKNYMLRVSRDVEAQKVVTSLLSDVNSKAHDFISESAKKLVVIGKTIKSLIEDHEKQRPEMLINWKELDRFAETPIKEQGVEIYKKIYLFVSLMQMY